MTPLPKVEVDCDECELGAAGIPCSFDGCKDLLHGCRSFLPFGWEEMTYADGSWFGKISPTGKDETKEKTTEKT
jgi:hypothetical protein